MTDRGSREASGEERPLLVKILNQAEKVVYDGARWLTAVDRLIPWRLEP